MTNIFKKDVSDKYKYTFCQKIAATTEKQIFGYWYPLWKIQDTIPVLAFDAQYFDDEEKLKLLTEILKEGKIYNAYVVPEFDCVYWTDELLDYVMEQDEDGFIFPHCSEEYIFDDTKTWLIYTSHECTITFAGEWLVNKIKEKIPNYQDGIWGNYIAGDFYGF